MTATAINPILYAWMNSSFREEFIRALPFLRRIFVFRQPVGGNRRPRIITDCEPALNRKNCIDNVRVRKLTFSSTPSSLLRSSFDNYFNCSMSVIDDQALRRRLSDNSLLLSGQARRHSEEASLVSPLNFWSKSTEKCNGR